MRFTLGKIALVFGISSELSQISRLPHLVVILRSDYGVNLRVVGFLSICTPIVPVLFLAPCGHSMLWWQMFTTSQAFRLELIGGSAMVVVVTLLRLGRLTRTRTRTRSVPSGRTPSRRIVYDRDRFFSLSLGGLQDDRCCQCFRPCLDATAATFQTAARVTLHGLHPKRKGVRCLDALAESSALVRFGGLSVVFKNFPAIGLFFDRDAC